jgi:Antitoxin VbhA
MSELDESEVERNLRAIEHAIAQQELEGLKVSKETIEDMRRAARGEIDSDDVIANIHARLQGVPILRG